MCPTILNAEELPAKKPAKDAAAATAALFSEAHIVTLSLAPSIKNNPADKLPSIRKSIFPEPSLNTLSVAEVLKWTILLL